MPDASEDRRRTAPCIGNRHVPSTSPVISFHATAFWLRAAPVFTIVVDNLALAVACAKEAEKRLSTKAADVPARPTEFVKGTCVENAQVLPDDGGLVTVAFRIDGKKHCTAIAIGGMAFPNRGR